MRKILVDFVPGLLGGLVGGVVGYFVFGWLLRYGLWAPVIPGAFAGLGCGLSSITNSTLRGAFCAIEALLIGVVANWLLLNPPFETNGSLRDYATKVFQLPPPTLFMLALGIFLGFWWGREATFPWRSRFASVTDRE